MAEKINTEEFDKIVGEGGAVLVDFYADWCGPCKMMAPVLEQVASENSDKCSFFKVISWQKCSFFKVISSQKCSFFKVVTFTLWEVTPNTGITIRRNSANNPEQQTWLTNTTTPSPVPIM